MRQFSILPFFSWTIPYGITKVKFAFRFVLAKFIFLFSACQITTFLIEIYETHKQLKSKLCRNHQFINIYLGRMHLSGYTGKGAMHKCTQPSSPLSSE